MGDPTKNPIKDFKELKAELKSYSKKLEHLPSIVIANKMDMPKYYEQLNIFKKYNPNLEIVRISAFKKIILKN